MISASQRLRCASRNCLWTTDKSSVGSGGSANEIHVEVMFGVVVFFG